MADTTISPNMGLPVPNVSNAPGPDWAASLNACLAIIDQHNHTSGEGAPIPPDGFVISTDLSFGGYSATNMASVLFTAQSSLSDLNALYVSGVDLYFNDGSGSPAIQITSGGAVNATSSGISSGTNTASFVSNVLVVNTNSTTPADIQGGSVYLGNNTSNTKFLKLSPPSAMAANYTITLIGQGAIPVSGSAAITIDSTGTMGSGFIAAAQIPNNSINSGMLQAGCVTNAKLANNSVSSGIIQDDAVTAAKIAANAVTTIKILDDNVTKVKIATVPVSAGTNSGSFTTSSTSAQNVCSTTITSFGKPVIITLRNDQSSATPTYIGVSRTSGSLAAVGFLRLLQDGSEICRFEISTGTTSTVDCQVKIPPSSFFTISQPAAGAHTYQLTAFVSAGTGGEQIQVQSCSLLAYEMA